MPIATPAATNYPSPLVAIPSTSQDEPIEGRHVIPVEVLWGSMGGATKTVDINVQNNATLEFTQISSLKVDNSACTVPVTFVFADLAEQIVIPANHKLAVIPIFSNAKEFTVSAPTAVATDITRFKIFNHPNFPVAIA